MKENQLIKGNEYIYLPNVTDFNSLQKIYFLFIRKIQDSNFNNTQYIFAKDKSIINKYATLQDYESDLNKSTFIGFSQFVIDNNLSFFREYSEKKEQQILQMYKFFISNEGIYKKLLKYTKLYSSGNESFFWSRVFTSFRKNMFLYKTRFYFLLFVFIIIGTLKFPLYIPIFFIDIIKSSISAYRNYKKSEAKLKDYRNNNFMTRMMLNVTEEEFEKQKEEAQNNLDDIKEKYINTNIAIFTLLIAFVTFIFSLSENSKSIGQIKKQNDEIFEKIELVNIENSQLKNELILERNKNLIINDIINSELTILHKEENDKEEIEKKIESIELEINDLKNNE